MSIESLMPSNHLILCHPLLLLPSIFPNIRVFSNESALCIRWLKYWSFSISPSNENSGLISLGLTILIFLLSKGLSRVLSTTIWKHQFTGAQPSLWSNSHICTWQLEKNIALASGILWNLLAFSVIQWMLAVWSLVPLPFLNPGLYIWKFLVHILLKPSLKDFEHYLASMWNEHNCTGV